MTGHDDAQGASLGKRSYGGEEWDYLLDVEVDSTKLKLPLNRGDDPWMAAQKFIWEHNLDQSNLDQVTPPPPPPPPPPASPPSIDAPPHPPPSGGQFCHQLDTGEHCRTIQRQR